MADKETGGEVVQVGDRVRIISEVTTDPYCGPLADHGLAIGQVHTVIDTSNQPPGICIEGDTWLFKSEVEKVL